MGIFDIFQPAAPEPEQRSRARCEFDQAAGEFNRRGTTLWVSCEPNRTFGFAKWKLKADTDSFYLMPDLDPDQADDDTLSRALPLTLRRSQAEAVLEPITCTTCSQEGLITEYEIPDLRLRLSGDRVTETVFTAANTKANLELLRTWGFPSKTLFGLFDCPENPDFVPLDDGGELLPTATMGYSVWREDDRLAFQQRINNLYSHARTFKLGFLPLHEIKWFKACGEVRTEMRVSGGETHMEVRDQSLGDMLLRGSQLNMWNLDERVEVKQKPIRLEELKHDERWLELRVSHGGTLHTLRFRTKAIEVFERLIPEKQYRETSAWPLPEQAEGREPTPAEQLEILAGLVDRGYLTRAEFEEAKPRLLAKL